MKTRKFIQSIDNGPPYRALKREAKLRGLQVQDVLRAVVIPEWLADQQPLAPYTQKIVLGLVEGAAQALGQKFIISVLKPKQLAKARSEGQSNRYPARPARSNAGRPLAPSRGKPS